MPGRDLRRTSLERDLARLADGTLKGSRRDLVERLTVSSPELQARLREQRHAIAATREIAQRERAPVALRIGRPTRAAPPNRRGRRVLCVALAGTAAALLWAAAAVPGGEAGLTVAQAATLAGNPPNVSVAEPRDDQVTLPGPRADGIPFPYWEDRFHWRAIGARTDRLAGRAATTVFYRRGGQTIAYTIVSGQALSAGLHSGLGMFSTAKGHVVSWLRRGHTCVLSGRGVPFAALVRLATWRGHGPIPY